MASLKQSLGDKLKAVNVQPTKQKSLHEQKAELLARMTAVQAKLSNAGVAVQRVDADVIKQVSECLSCCDPVPNGTFLCEPCKDGTRIW